MERESLISNDIIEKYELQDEFFECPICDEKLKSIFLNDHYAICKLDKLREINEEINKKNKIVDKKNKLNYYKVLFDKILFEKFSEFNFNRILMNNNLDFIKYDEFKNYTIVCGVNLQNTYENIIYLNKDINNLGTENTFIVNFSDNINCNEYDESVNFLHINYKNLYTADIENLYTNINDKNMYYFSEINFIEFCSKILNIPNDSKLIIIIAFIKISLLNSEEILLTKINIDLFSPEEKELLEYLIELKYISES